MSGAVRGFRLSPQQKRLWMLLQESAAYRTQGAVLFAGALDPAALRGALECLIERHQILRTVFQRSPGIRFPIQIIGDSSAPEWKEIDLSAEEGAEAEIERLFATAAHRPFDLERGPLVSATLVKLAADRHVLLLGLPALTADPWSLRLLVRELGDALVGELSPAEEVVQYLDYSEWQNELLESGEGESGRGFWKSSHRLHWVRALKLPAGFEAAGRGGFKPGSVPLELDPAAGQAEEVAARLGVSVPAVLLTAWQALLWRLGGRERAGVGVFFDGRRQEELEGTPGLFARYLPMSFELAGRLPFAEAVARTEEALSEAADYGDFYAPPEGPKATVAMPACFSYEEHPGPRQAGGVTISLLRQSAPLEKFAVCLSATRAADGLKAELHYDTQAVDGGFATALGERFRSFLTELTAAPETPVGAPQILTGGERQKLLVEFNRTSAELPGEGFPQLFEAQVSRTPRASAVEFVGERITYAELAERADRLAHHLIAAGVGADALVGIATERSAAMVAATLAVWKAGGAYLPLDLGTPPERLAFMISDARPVLLLTQSDLAESLPEGGPPVLLFDRIEEETAPASASPPAVAAGGDQLAYVIYTSGSTGKPKGVMVSHRGLVNYLSWAASAYASKAGDRVPVHTPMGFDLTITSVFLPLITGGTAVLLPEDRGLEALAETVEDGSHFGLMKLTPAHLTMFGPQLKDADLSGWSEVVVLGGEALFGENLSDLRRQAPTTRLINEYGPTETVVGSCVYEVKPDDEPAGAVPIGRPIANTELYLLDADLKPVPPGVVGELYIGGAGVARGYLGQPARTAERFVPHPFASSDERLYRTGDLVRYLPAGDLEFLGRNDHQVKIRGFRLELGEIEAVLAGHPGLREVAVLAREDNPGERRLVAYLVAEQETLPTVDELRGFLAPRLPEYMIPSVFMPVPAMPLTAHGKVDRASLPAPGSARPDLAREYVAPRTPQEEMLAEVWKEVLGIDKVGVHDSFFALGGDSIRSVLAVAELKERNFETSVEELFRHQTISELVAAVAGGDEPAGETEEERLARLVGELEGLSEDEARERLNKELEAVEPG